MRRRFHSLGCLLLLLAAAGCAGNDRAGMESTLKTNLRTLRDLIDQYQGDQGYPPPTLAALVEKGYFRQLPYDPITRRNDTWIEIREPGEADRPPRIVDVHSGAPGRARDGTLYADW